MLRESLSDNDVKVLIDKLQALSDSKAHKISLNDHPVIEQQELASAYTLSSWCDQTLGTTIQDHINHELIKWCGGFLDEGHAPWPMPLRDKTFYGGW
jgi:uncharacterized protein YbcC (UPF0753/DUF2309 family)